MPAPISIARHLASTDYTDYSEAYDTLYSSVGGLANYFYYQDAAGNTIDPRQWVIGSDHFKKMSQEFRVASPQDERFRVVAGAVLSAPEQRDPSGLSDPRSRPASCRSTAARARCG